ncbi:MAG TPA: hypothetical protein VF698_09625 [Thermoanaerobaculia bacterium]|jgi:hypothetical protein
MIRKSLFSLVLLLLIATPTLAQTKTKARVAADASRLASLLQDVQNKSTVSEAAWKTIANEGNALANRVYGYTSGQKTARTAATELRKHVRLMRTAAMKGDADEARKHASEALPFAYKLIDWAT